MDERQGLFAREIFAPFDLTLREQRIRPVDAVVMDVRDHIAGAPELLRAQQQIETVPHLRQIADHDGVAIIAWAHGCHVSSPVPRKRRGCCD
jgi:hypothetical protein